VIFLKSNNFKENSITLWGAVGLGTGVMFGAAIFAVVGQVAEIAGEYFPFSYVLGALVAALSSYSYIKMSQKYPSAGGIGMFFVKIYGKNTITASSSLLMAISMVIAQSLVARTFGTYTMQIFNIGPEHWSVTILAVGLLLFTYIVNRSENDFIQTFTSTVSLIKIVGIIIFSFAALKASQFSTAGLNLIEISKSSDVNSFSFIASVALSLLSFKGFTTITNNGDEIVEPKKNIGRAIIISISLLTVIYVFMSWAVSSSLPIKEIVAAKDYSLAEAAKPTLGKYGVWFTIGIAILATITVCIGSVFAVSRMTTMLTDMNLIPHSHFGMKGDVHRHMLVYIIVIGIVLTVIFDIGRIASIGAIFYIVMDLIFQYGILKKIKNEIKAKTPILIASIGFDLIVLAAFLWYKIKSDLLIIIISFISIIIIFVGEKLFLEKFSELGDN
jgi:amino acid transporter